MRRLATEWVVVDYKLGGAVGKPNTIVIATSVVILAGCFTAHIARLPAEIDAERDPQASIEECLSSLGLHDASQRYAGGSFAGRDDFVALWETPPVEYESDLHRRLNRYNPSNTNRSALVWRPHGRWTVRLMRDDESIARNFASCMSSADTQIPIELDPELYFDPS